MSTEALHQQIDNKIREKGYRFLNNFWTNLPWDKNFTIEKMEEWVKKIGEKEAFYFLGHRRVTRIISGKLDIKHGVLNENANAPEGWRHSEVYNAQTPREFFHTVDQVVNELFSIDLPVNPFVTQGASLSEESVDSYQKSILPIYLKLREMGYSDGDLVL